VGVVAVYGCANDARDYEYGDECAAAIVFTFLGRAAVGAFVGFGADLLATFLAGFHAHVEFLSFLVFFLVFDSF